MNFDLTDEQEHVRRSVREFAESEILPNVHEWDEAQKFPQEEMRRKMADLGWLGVLQPEEYGGSAMGMLEGVILYEEFGSALAPTPHLVSCVVSAGALLAAGSDEQKERGLRPIAKGDAILTPAGLEPDNGCGPRGWQMRATTKRPMWKLRTTPPL